ncbi:hypothetical protein P885DRAFT_74450 [Corynascus similis CBS 632.67]
MATALLSIATEFGGDGSGAVNRVVMSLTLAYFWCPRTFEFVVRHVSFAAISTVFVTSPVDCRFSLDMRQLLVFWVVHGVSASMITFPKLAPDRAKEYFWQLRWDVCLRGPDSTQYTNW